MNNDNNKIFLVTGGTSGVGKATAISLVQQNNKVVIIGRNAQNCEATIEEIARRTGNNKTEYLLADLSLKTSVKKVAEDFKNKYDNLHVLANCVGAMFSEMQFTTENIESSFAINYMSHFWLTTNLLDILKANHPARIITIGGNALFLKNAKLDFDNLQYTNNFNGLKAAANAMYARLFFTLELAKRLEGTKLTANIFNSGPIKSNLMANAPWYIKIATKLFKPSEKDICDIASYLATSHEVENISGRFFKEDKKIVPLHEKFDSNIGKRLWEISEQL
jgi:NAD(P)-dependent dehydrogenase (short-subunit alcohol dehydrogenase family)